MRNPERIRPFLDKLAETWEKYPDLPLGDEYGSMVRKFVQ